MKAQGDRFTAIPFLSVEIIERIARTGILLCPFLVIAYCVWTLDRGFEITDEAYYLLLAMHAGSVKLFISAQQWITAGLWQLTGSLATFRAAGLASLLVSSALLGLGVFSICLRFGLVTDHFELKWVVLAGSVVGAMLYASTINLSPSYNLLASTGAYAAAGMALLASNRSSILQKYALLTMAGCAIGAETLCKPSAGVATLALLVLWVSIFECSRFDKRFGPVALVFGAITFAGIVLLVNTTISDATQGVEQGMQIFRMVQVEAVEARLIRYFIEFLGYFLTTLRAFAVPIVAMTIYAMTRRPIFAQCGLVTLVATLIFGNLHAGLPTLSTFNATSGSYLFGGFNRYDAQIVAIFSMLLMMLIVTIPVWSKNRNTFALFIGLFLLPYSVGIGTGNALFTQVIDSLAPWGALIAVLVVARQPDHVNKIPSSLIGSCFMVTIALQIVTSNFRPYNLSLPLTRQDQATTVGQLGEVKVDAGTYKFLAEMKAAAKVCEIAPGAPFFGLYNIPGVALALQATPVLTPWINNRAQAEFVIERVRSEDLHSAVVAFQMKGRDFFPPIPQQMAAFPLGYRYCGMATYPYMHQRIQIWKVQTQ
ncbi:hypothetical protein [Polaromonas jejuensis]|uniref:Glycosyltransferase RgtA/B/C/D-like domain-containing protein n=1 Tax=Polaromonas jejuensis TaxID=457502 RepID=A0ABW0Q6U5_9BURK|nr:hypothetical protein [Polaromonas jejuensis]